MKKTCKLFPLLASIILLFTLALVTNPQTNINNRNLKDFDKGPTVAVPSYTSTQSDETDEEDIFLWKLWSNKRLAYYVINYFTREGEITPCTFYVEKNKTDSWQVTQECDRINVCPYISKERCREYRYSQVIYDKIDRIDLKDGKFYLFFHKSKSK
jgi:hypothetical protein